MDRTLRDADPARADQGALLHLAPESRYLCASPGSSRAWHFCTSS